MKTCLWYLFIGVLMMVALLADFIKFVLNVLCFPRRLQAPAAVALTAYAVGKGVLRLPILFRVGVSSSSSSIPYDSSNEPVLLLAVDLQIRFEPFNVFFTCIHLLVASVIAASTFIAATLTTMLSQPVVTAVSVGAASFWLL